MVPLNQRILIADDLVNIHEDFQKILAAPQSSLATVPGLSKFAPELLLEEATERPHYSLSFVSQGDEAIRAVTRARADGQPYAILFLDVRMPPGIDGVETAQRVLAVDPDVQIVLCTAYTDYSFAEISARFSRSPNFLILKKPFDPAEVLQVVLALTTKWALAQRERQFTKALTLAAPALRALAPAHPALTDLAAMTGR